MLKNYLFSAFSLFQPSFSFSFSAAPFFFFFFGAFSSFLFLVQCLFLLFLSSHVALFSAQNLFLFNPKHFSLQPKRVAPLSSAPLFFFSFLVSASFFSSFFSPYIFKGQPKTCYSPKSPLNLSNSCVPLYQDEVKLLASRPRGTHFSCQFSSQKKKKIFLQPPFIQNPIFSLVTSSLLFE